MPEKTDFVKLAHELQASLDSARVEQAQLERAIADATARADEAEQRAAKAESDLRITETLKKAEYQRVISELFERPSRMANAVTVGVGVLTLLVSVGATFFYGRAQSADQIRQLQVLLGARMSGTAAASAPATVPPLSNTPIVIDASSNRALGLSLAAGQFVDVRVAAPAGFNAFVRARAVSGDVQLSAWQSSPANQLCNTGSVGSTEASCSFQVPRAGDFVVRVRATRPSVVQLWWQHKQ